MAKLKFSELEPDADLVKLDLGCGKGQNTPEGFQKIDLHKSPGVRAVDLRKRWPWKANSVDEVQANFLLNCLTMSERCHFANELHRVLKVGSKALLMLPHWAASRAYGYPGNQFPPVAEAWFPWLNKGWREAQNVVGRFGLTCDFDHSIGYGMHGSLLGRNQEYQQHAVMFWKEAAQDLIVTLTKL